MTLSQDPIEKMYFYTTEVSKALSIHHHTIRYYGREFGLGFKGAHGKRIRVSVKQVGQLAIILRLTEFFKIEAAKAVFHSGRSEEILAALEPKPGGVPMWVEGK